MSGVLSAFVKKRQGDAAPFVDRVQALAMGIVRDHQPARFYVIRIDNWFGPRWFHFSGKAIGLIGVHRRDLPVPPFVPHRVVTEHVFVGPDYVEGKVKSPLHLDCASGRALQRRIADVDQDAAFLWFSSESESQKRGSVMVYLPLVSDESGFYVGFSEGPNAWEPSMLRGVSRSEVTYIEERGRNTE